MDYILNKDFSHHELATEHEKSPFWDELEKSSKRIDFSDFLIFDERYVDHSLIGEGAFKNVSSTYDNLIKRRVAYAKIKDGVDECHDEQLIYEAWLTSSLNHPNIIKVHGIGVSKEERPFFTMELKGSQSLKDLVKDQAEEITLPQAFLKVCEAMDYAHSEGVLHLD